MQFALEPAIPALELHKQHWHNCTRCPLHTFRHKVVLWRGYVPCDICFIGEAPGEQEDNEGFPFVGPAGMLLDDLIHDTLMALDRDGETIHPTLAITNVVACLPLENQLRPPTSEEIEACHPRLVEFLKLAKPKHVVMVGDIAKSSSLAATLGQMPSAFLLPGERSLQVQTHNIIHPAAILRSREHTATQTYLRTITKLMEIFTDIEEAA